jgi:hypothetical protein
MKVNNQQRKLIKQRMLEKGIQNWLFQEIKKQDVFHDFASKFFETYERTNFSIENPNYIISKYSIN